MDTVTIILNLYFICPFFIIINCSVFKNNALHYVLPRFLHADLSHDTHINWQNLTLVLCLCHIYILSLLLFNISSGLDFFSLKERVNSQYLTTTSLQALKPQTSLWLLPSLNTRSSHKMLTSLSFFIYIYIYKSLSTRHMHSRHSIYIYAAHMFSHLQHILLSFLFIYHFWRNFLFLFIYYFKNLI